MANVVGIDLGAYSVKMTVVAPGFRQSTVIGFYEMRVPEGPEPALERAVAVAAKMLRINKLDGDQIYVAVPGKKVFIHVLEFPFKSLRRAELESAVGAELESILPIDLEDMVYTFEQLPKAASGGADLEIIGDDDPTAVHGVAPAVGRVAPPTDGMRVLACAMQRDKARELVASFDGIGGGARGLLAAPASYGRIASRISALKVVTAGRVGSALIDIGHERTDVCVVVDGRIDFVRTINRGGRKVTEAIMKSFGIDDLERAEQAKHADGLIGSAAEPPRSEQYQRIHEAVVGELKPLARDLKRTLSACRAKTGVMVEQAVLVGGGSRLRGIAPFFAEQLGIRVSTLSAEDAAAMMGPKLAETGVAADVICQSAGVALEGATGKPHFDLRQGDLAFKADLSFLRAKAGQLAAALLVIIAFAAGSAYMSLYKLRKAEKVLTERLAVESTTAFQESLTAEEVLARIQPSGARKSPIPKVTAYDKLLELNNHLPPRDQVKIDIRDLEIKNETITIKATAFPTEKGSALDGIEALETEIKKSKCFKEVTPGESQPGADDTREFSLAIKSSCS
jgi:Tfp pilus assembly PilM family ATPase